jgi:hypothetical protein
LSTNSGQPPGHCGREYFPVFFLSPHNHWFVYAQHFAD